MAVGFVKDKVTVNVANYHSARKINVSDLLKHQRVAVVNVAGAVGRDENLRAVVGHADRTSAGNAAYYGCVPRRINLVERSARHCVAVTAQVPQATDRAGAQGSQQTQAGGTLQEGRLFACFWNDFRKQVDHPRIGSVDAAGNVGRAEDGRLHQ